MSAQYAHQGRWDAIVVGAGHNGLVTAARLAKAGLKVLVLESRETIGGAAGTEQVFPGFRANSGAADAGMFLPQVAAELNLEDHGLEWIESPALVFAPQVEGEGLAIWRQPDRTIAEIAARSPADAERYPRFLESVGKAARVLKHMMALTPPALPKIQAGEAWPWLRPALALRGLGKHEMMEFMRVLPMPVFDFLDEWFEDRILKAALGASGVTGSFAGPRSAGTALMFLYQATAGHVPYAARFPAGGTGALCAALAEVATGYGAEMRTRAKVARVLVEEQRANGVLLENGERIQADCIVSNLDPRRTFFDLVGASELEVRTVRELKNVRMQASLARIDLALQGLPVFAGRPGAHAQGALSGHILIGPDLDEIERAFDAAKYGQVAERPMLRLTIPTLNDPGLAPGGAHLMSVDVYYAPYELTGVSWEQYRERLLEKTLSLLERYAPGFQRLVTQSRVSTPRDLEQRLGLTRGDIFHGQMGLDQLLMLRPFPAASRYSTPISNLYLCGAGSHPGGGITGAPGYNAARQMLKDLGR